MDDREEGLHPGWATLILVLVLAAAIWLTYALFTGTFRKSVPVTLTSDRAGLVMETNAKVKLRGVQVGRVAAITGGREPGHLEIGDRPGPDQEHSSERRSADPGHHGLRCQVRRSGLSRRSQLAAAGGRSGAEVAQRQHRGQHGVRERCPCAGHDRPGQAQQHPVRTRGRRPWTGRTDRSGHHRRQSGSARTEPAQ